MGKREQKTIVESWQLFYIYFSLEASVWLRDRQINAKLNWRKKFDVASNGIDLLIGQLDKLFGKYSSSVWGIFTYAMSVLCSLFPSLSLYLFLFASVAIKLISICFQFLVEFAALSMNTSYALEACQIAFAAFANCFIAYTQCWSLPYAQSLSLSSTNSASSSFSARRAVNSWGHYQSDFTAKLDLAKTSWPLCLLSYKMYANIYENCRQI